MGIEEFVLMLQSRAVNVGIINLDQTGAIKLSMKVAALPQAREISLARCVIPEIHVRPLAGSLNLH